MNSLINKYFPEITPKQTERFAALFELYEDWNSKINVISRKDMDNFYERHVLHSLGIAKVIQFMPGSRVLDVGTGGGFPGIPLAIMFPDTEFTLVDSIGKKIKVVRAVADSLGLENVVAINQRCETVQGSFQFIVSRAVTSLPTFLGWVQGKTPKKSKHPLGNGILYLKGGDLQEELTTVRHPYNLFRLHDYFSEDFFESKMVVHIPL